MKYRVKPQRERNLYLLEVKLSPMTGDRWPVGMFFEDDFIPHPCWEALTVLQRDHLLDKFVDLAAADAEVRGVGQWHEMKRFSRLDRSARKLFSPKNALEAHSFTTTLWR